MPTDNKIRLKGGEFLLKETLSNDIFTPEDFSEEQFVFQRKQDHGNTFKLQDLYSKKVHLKTSKVIHVQSQFFHCSPLECKRKSADN